MSRPENAFAAAGARPNSVEADAEPLGFSDLEPDEALLVALFRRWRHGSPTAAIAAHALAVWLQRLGVHQYIDLLLDVFQSIGNIDGAGAERLEHPLLTPAEEALIAHMAAVPRGPAASSPFSVRSLEAIPRSGHDRLEMRIAQSYSLVQGCFNERF